VEAWAFQRVRENGMRAIVVEQIAQVPAPEGPPTIAQRFSAGKSGKDEPVPEGRLKFSRTHWKRRAT